MNFEYLRARLTNGRPMKRIEYRFTDVVSGQRIYYFRDYWGRYWLAARPWSLFRVDVIPYWEELGEPSPHEKQGSVYSGTKR